MTPTPRQKQVLEFVAQYIQEHGISPTYEEIGRALGLRSLASVWRHIGALKQRGLIELAPTCGRAIRVVPQGKTILWVDRRTSYKAWFAHNPGLWGSGRTLQEAIGDLVLAWRGELSPDLTIKPELVEGAA